MGRVTEYIDFLNRKDKPKFNEYSHLTIKKELEIAKMKYKKALKEKK